MVKLWYATESRSRMFSVITWGNQPNDDSCQPNPSLPSHKPSGQELRYLQSLGLFFNEPEPAIICTRCVFALKADSDRVSRHLGERHGLARQDRLGLNKLIRSLQIPDPKRLLARPDGQEHHAHLALQRGAACLHCRFYSTSDKVLHKTGAQ